MAIEVGRFLSQQLATLPEGHPDRPFLEGLAHVVGAYVGHDGELQEVGPAQALPSPAEQVVWTGNELAEATSDPEKGQRVRLSGNLGAPPRFRTTPKGVRRGEFNLAVHEQDDSTTWHTVLAFRERAQKLEQLKLARGQSVEVIGYRHQRQTKGRDGQPKTVEEIVAANVRAR